MDRKTFKKEFAGRPLEIEFSPLAEQADASCLIKYGETVALVTLVCSKQDENLDYFPLMVDYEEKFYAAGKIYGSRFVRRETRPTEIAILTGRMVDRTIRPLFDQNTRRKTQIVVTILSIDRENDPDFVALLGASIVSSLSPIPFRGPAAGIRIAKVNNQTVVLPTYEQRLTASIDSFWGGTENKLNMVEVGAKEVPEKDVEDLAETGFAQIKELIQWQKEILKELQADTSTKLSTSKIEIKNPADSIPEEDKKIISEFINARLEQAMFGLAQKSATGGEAGNQPKNKTEKIEGIERIQTELTAFLMEKEKNDLIPAAQKILEKMMDEIVHEKALKESKRVDGRKLDELRNIEVFTGVLPRTHGTGLFLRGMTHALSVVTLGAPGDILMMQGMEVSGEKRFIHHYNFPAFSTGETGPNRGPGRREIGHGALAEKAIEPMIPPQDVFPYTIRVVTEILSSNGSTSMASVCGTSLALMDAGVPIKQHVAGIAMGLMMDNSPAGEDSYKILTDIQGPEDHYGDMDCKVAGTIDGINAVQMDVKIEGITPKILSEVMVQAKKARLEILEKMNTLIKEPRKELSPHAPGIATIKIPKEKIGGVIGTGGKIIHGIMDESGAAIDIEEDGTIFVTGQSKESLDKAIEMIKAITKEYEVGEMLEGKVVKILDFGAIIDLGGGQEGLVHISELAPRRIATVEEIVKLGEVIPVKIIEVLNDGKIRLSLKQATNHVKNSDTNK